MSLSPRFVEAPGFATGRKRVRGAKGLGLSYQRKVENGLRGEIHGLGLVPLIGPWIEYGEGRLCQPDILCVSPALASRLSGEGTVAGCAPSRAAKPVPAEPSSPRCLIIEVKLRHSPRAWTQLVELYGPLVRELFGVPPRLVEVTRSFDCATPWPERPRLIRALEEAPDCGVGIMPWGFL